MMTQEQLPLKIQNIDEYQTKLIGDSPAWLKDSRQRAVAQFAQLGLPTIKDEEWKYLSLAELSSKRLQLASPTKFTQQEALNNYIDQNDLNIVLVNGIYSRELSSQSLPHGLVVLPLSEAMSSFSNEIQESFNKLTSNDSKALFYLNQALFKDGIFIKVDHEAVINSLIHIIHVTSDIQKDTVLFPRSMIYVGSGSKAAFLESYLGLTSENYWNNPITDIKVSTDSNVQYCKAEGESAGAIHTGNTRIWQEQASHLDSFTFAHGAKLVRNNLAILLKGEGANTIMNGFYAVDGQQQVDNHTLLDIQQPNCTSYQLYKGILNDASHVVFNGKIYVHPIAQKTNGYQLNKHLMLGKDVRLDTKPQLEIFADDVKCTHGATIGQLNDEEIFYLQSRCINKDLARQLMANGFIDDILNTIPSESIRRKLKKLLAEKFPDIKF